MDEEELIKEHQPLIFLALKREHLFWKTQDELQDYIDAGYDGLLSGIRAYNDTKEVKQSTFYYTCIRNEMFKVITRKNRKKNSTYKTISLNVPITDVDEIVDLIPDDTNLEEEYILKERNDKLIEMINRLPIERDRYVIKMLFGLDGWEKLNASQIANKWGVNKNAIIHRKNRALRILWYRIKKEGL